MDYTTRCLHAEDLEQALSLTWKTFLEFEAPDYSSEGVASFKRDIIDNPTFSEACKQGTNQMWGAFSGNDLVGLMVLRNENHICLAFVDKDHQRKGIGSTLFSLLVQHVKTHNPSAEQLTVNSSPYGIPFYHKLGFVDLGKEQTLEGIRFTAMVYQL